MLTVAPDGCPILVVAVSGRALAASARRGGHPVVVLDCFADADTAELSGACRAVVSRHGLRFDRASLLAAAQELAPPGSSLVYGSGFEGRVSLLERLARGRALLGNRPSVVTAVRDPRAFFGLLDRLHIPYPRVRLTRPANPRGWLAKRPGGAGGTGVRFAGSSRTGRTVYFQRFAAGRTLSALFLADGCRARVLGFNEQWTAARSGLPFVYGGAVGGVTPPPAVASAVAAGLDALVAATGLVGLNGLDFILGDGDEWLALELNPRPTATMELYDPDYPEGLLDRHLRACAGGLPPAAPAKAARAHAIVHAPGAAVVTHELEFPEWCRDLPRPGTRFSSGDPVCTVHASAPDAAAAVTLVRRRQAATLAVLQEAAA